MHWAKGIVAVATVVDHIDDSDSRADWHTFMNASVQSLCRPCHEMKSGRAIGGKKEWIGEDGLPLDATAIEQRRDSVRFNPS
jgi:hypothetical protein